MSLHTFLSFFFLVTLPPPRSTLFPYTTLLRSSSNADVAPTILSILGIKPPQPMDGRVLSEALVKSKTPAGIPKTDRKSTRLNSSHVRISYAVFCLKTNKKHIEKLTQMT